MITEEALQYLAKIALEAYSLMDVEFSNYEESNKEVEKYKISSNSCLLYTSDAADD